jgi:hypothetical protein
MSVSFAQPFSIAAQPAFEGLRPVFLSAFGIFRVLTGPGLHRLGSVFHLLRRKSSF